MRIGIITPFYYPNLIGGSEVSVKLLAEKLVELDNSVTVLTFDRNEKISALENVNGVVVSRSRPLIKKAAFLTLIPTVAWAMKKHEEEVDVYHVYNVSPSVGAAFYKMLGGKRKVISTLNNYIALCPAGTAVCGVQNCNFIKRIKCLKSKKIGDKAFSLIYAILFPILKIASRNLDHYIALSKAVKKYYTENGFKSEKITIIPNFTQLNIKKNLQLETAKTNKFNILYVGTLSKAKGTDILIRAFKKILETQKNIHLTLVGSGTMIEDYRRLVKELGIADNVTFTGRLGEEDKIAYYAKADLFVHPAIWQEPFGRTMLEAMSFNIPLVVSDVGAPPEIVDAAGLIFRNGDVEDLKKKIESIIENPELKQKLTANCAITLEKYEPDKIIRQIVNIYKKVIAAE